MTIEHIHTYLVRPGKGSKETSVGVGTNVPLTGKVFKMLDSIYGRTDEECDIDISFSPQSDGTQTNECRSLVIEYLKRPSLDSGRKIAERLQSVTDKRSGLGLLFLIAGRKGRDQKIVLSRFPTDTAILAEEKAHSLTVEFLDQVFMKSASSYKAATFEHQSLSAGFWIGRAIDRQINSHTIQVSNYWIADFLSSDFRLTPAAGTRRLCIALLNAARGTKDMTVKSEISAAATLVGKLGGKSTTIREFLDVSRVSEQTKAEVLKQLKSKNIANERFRFDLTEFRSQLKFRSIQLDNGATLSAEADQWNNVFEQRPVDGSTKEFWYSTKGEIVSEKLKKDIA